MKRSKAIYFCWYLMIFSISADFMSKGIYLLEVSAILGTLIIASSKKNSLKRFDYMAFSGMFIIMFGLIISRLFFTPEWSFLKNLSFLIKITSFFSFTYLFIKQFGFPINTLYLFAFNVIYHCAAYILGIGFAAGQFGSFYGDQNYLAPDLLASFCASLVLFNSKHKSLYVKPLMFILVCINVFLIIRTVSRTALMALILIILFFGLTLILKKTASSAIKLSFAGIILFLTFIIFSNEIIRNEYLVRYYDRFFESPEGADLLENERYFVWSLSYQAIQETGYFEGYGENQFLRRKYHFVSHNSWLHIGIRAGSYTFWSHCLLTALGLTFWLYRYFTNLKSFSIWGVESFALIFCISISFMMFSISVSHSYYYWFILFLVYIRAILNLDLNKKTTPRIFYVNEAKI